jgi:kumamolisin
MPARRLVLKGNRRPQVVPGSLTLRAPGAKIEVTLKLRPCAQSPAMKKRIQSLLQAPPNRRKYLSRAEHEQAFGLRPGDLAKVEAFARRNGLALLESHAAKRTVRLRGSVAQVQRAFGVRLRSLREKKARYHSHREAVSLPREISRAVRAVFGLDTRPIMKSHVLHASPDAGAGGGPGISPRDVRSLYQFPPGLDGSGRCLAIIEVNTPNAFLGGLDTGYRDTDLAQFFNGTGLKPPVVTPIPGANGAGNFPGVSDHADAEAALDIQMGAAAAPGAAIAVYFGLNCEQGYHDAMASAIHDTVRNPRVISTSWGLAEAEYGASFMAEMDQLFQEAATLGVTICASAGDFGSSGKDQGAADGIPHAHFPASSPSVLACGGTTLASQSGAVVSERVWNGTFATGAGGGGVSETFALPPWQKSCRVPASAQKKWAGRGIPDLAAHADQASGYRIIVNGEPRVLGGTSAVAPLIAGLLTCINQSRAAAGQGPVGFINPQLYSHPEAFRDIVDGNNDIDGSFGVYSAQSGWDACTGLGAPLGTSILKILS